MDQGTLVEMQITDGQRLIDRLAEEGIPVAAAFWAKETESGQWFLYLATPLVGKDGATLSAYRRVNAVIAAMPAPFWIHPLEVKVIAPTDPVAQDVLAVLGRGPGPRVPPIRWGGTRLGDVSIEGAYFYPLPAGASG
jgi:hypothetical protein